MSGKKPLVERRLDALYNHANASNSTTRKELLDYFLATISHKQVKDVVEHFNIKVEKE